MENEEELIPKPERKSELIALHTVDRLCELLPEGTYSIDDFSSIILKQIEEMIKDIKEKRPDTQKIHIKYRYYDGGDMAVDFCIEEEESEKSYEQRLKNWKNKCELKRKEELAELARLKFKYERKYVSYSK